MTEQEREKQGVREDEVSKWKIGQHREWNWQEILQQQIAAGLVAAEPFRCPTCGQSMRLPRGVGKVEVTCRSCSSHFLIQS